MAQTPVDSESSEYETALEGYKASWARLNASMRRGVSWSGGERNAAFTRSESGALDLIDAAPVLGLDHDDDGRAAARIDIDFDGDEDLIVTNRTGPRVRVLANRWAAPGPKIALRLVGTRSNPEGAGAVAFATPLGPDEAPPEELFEVGSTQRRTRSIGSGFFSQSSAWLRFAFPTDDPEPRVHLRVRWTGPNGGVVEDFGVVPAGGRYVLIEGSGAAQRAGSPPAVHHAQSELQEDVLEGKRRRLVLPVPAAIPSIPIRSRDGESARLFGITPEGPKGYGRPIVLVAWNSADPLGVVALGEIEDLCREAQAVGVEVMAVDLAAAVADAEFDPLVLGARSLARAGWTGATVGAAEETRILLQELVGWRFDRDTAPEGPWWFIMDPDGRLAILRTGPWAASDFSEDAAVLRLPASERPSVSTLYPGQWLNPPMDVDRARLRERIDAFGLEGSVRELDMANLSIVSFESAELQIKLGQAEVERGNVAGALVRFEAALEREPQNVLAHRSRAYALHLLERYDDALEAWNRALELDPENLQTRGNRALAAVAAGEEELARADLEVLTTRSGPGDPVVASVRRAIEWLESKEGR